MTGIAGRANRADSPDFAEGVGAWGAAATIDPEVKSETFECHRYTNIE